MSRARASRELEGQSNLTPLEQWKNISSHQEDLFARVLRENEVIRKQLEQIEFDYSNMKLAMSALAGQLAEKESLEAELADARRAIIPVETVRDLVLILIDGDGYIFLPELLKKGEIGGRKAATILSNGVAQYLAKQGKYTPKVVLWCMIFVSRERLENVLARTEACTSEQFQLFIKGFSQAYPLFSLVDVGANKEAADWKLREHLNEFIGNPKMLQVVAGVDHDNVYGAVLSAALTGGHGDRLALLQAHQDIAREIRPLNLNTFYIGGLFLEHSIQMISPITNRPHAQSQNTSWANAATVPPNHIGSPPPPTPRINAASATPTSTVPSTPRMGDKKTMKKGPCNHYYLSGSCTSLNCAYGHDYVLSDVEREALRNVARLQPCQYVNNNGTCYVKNCFYGHKCPRGPQCSYRRNATCRFKGDNMHDP